MGSTYGKQFRVTLFGESHGHSIGCVIEGIPAGTILDLAFIKKRLFQRKPGKDQYSTPRQEKDAFDIVSGYFMDKTTGTPLCAIFKNGDTRSKDYAALKAAYRPGHADFTGAIKYNGANDYRGGGHFSARLTAPLVFAGAIAEQLLNDEGIEVMTQIQRVGHLSSESFETLELNATLKAAFDDDGYAIHPDMKTSFLELVDEVRMAKDSVGGVVEAMITGLPVGIGEPFFDSFESKMAHGLFAVPAVKGVSFGKGFDFPMMRGSQANDPFYLDGETVKTKTNHNAGINGGITNGMPVWFNCAFKPTPSIAKRQLTLNVTSGDVEPLEIQGRHDPCVALRGALVVKAMASMVTYDLLREGR